MIQEHLHGILPNEEPLLYDLLEDPITHMLMQIDGVQREKLEPMLQKAREQVDAREAA